MRRRQEHPPTQNRGQDSKDAQQGSRQPGHAAQQKRQRHENGRRQTAGKHAQRLRNTLVPIAVLAQGTCSQKPRPMS
eukprot:14644540-Alexandrium_andersonii.AAC.1